MAFGFIKRVGKGTVKTVANVPSWLSFGYLKNNTKGLYQTFRPMYKIPKESEMSHKQTFAEVVQQYQLTEQDLFSRLKKLQFHVLLFGTLGVLAFFYMIYIFMYGDFLSSLLVLGIVVFFALKVIHARLWIFQIRHKKLGCTLREWWRGKPEEPK